MSNLLFKCLLNASFAVIYAYSMYYDYYKLTETIPFLPVPGLYVSKFCWLTMINLYLHFVYNLIGAIFACLDVQNSVLLRPFHFLATSIVFPAGFTVVVLFWGLVFLDPAFLVDENAMIIFAHKWFNHSIHTLPLITMLADFCIWKHTRPTRKSAFMAILLFVFLYMADIHYFYYVHGFWAYPILADLPPVGRVLFLFCCSIIVFLAFLVGDIFNWIIHAIWRKQKRDKKRSLKAAAKSE